ncbi:hypothetical protein CCACVL1_30799 [Corchorus capsularis]|uniref:Retrotransposon gag protein n=1 Tax=Corchorus capsularis TaxID=210143 RepID=A0A1R3FVC9_COCAP|nr:hypothetical protein CCACVL1_30799 [Corchorus capsularis]
MEAITSLNRIEKEEGDRPRDVLTNGDFPLTKDETKGSKKIINVYECESEDFGECWERFKEACEDCPEYSFNDEGLLQYFHESLKILGKRVMGALCQGSYLGNNPREMIKRLESMANVASGGSMMDQTTKEARVLINDLARDIYSSKDVDSTNRGLEEKDTSQDPLRSPSETPNTQQSAILGTSTLKDDINAQPLKEETTEAIEIDKMDEHHKQYKKGHEDQLKTKTPFDRIVEERRNPSNSYWPIRITSNT